MMLRKNIGSTSSYLDFGLQFEVPASINRGIGLDILNEFDLN
jgi:hypothetical protein